MTAFALPMAKPATYTRQVNNTGHCQAARPCDSMALVYDLDCEGQITVVFVLGLDVVAKFPGKACTFQRKDG
jgi:hypothetical protein